MKFCAICGEHHGKRCPSAQSVVSLERESRNGVYDGKAVVRHLPPARNTNDEQWLQTQRMKRARKGGRAMVPAIRKNSWSRARITSAR